MKIKYILFFLLFTSALYSKAPIITKDVISSPPPRIIRTCCSFGVDVKLFAFTFIKFTDITSIEKIGSHKYLGQKEENNGIIYTQKGGFIDLGHLRDIADFTGYLYTLIQSVKADSSFSIKLGNEAGHKKLNFSVPPNATDKDIVHLAGKIAYDISVWHEISTWFGASYIPLVPERYSSFSVEDAYSNLLGVHLGMNAILSDLEFENSMTTQINDTLKKLEAVNTLEQTYAAMNGVKDIWWSSKAKMPSRKVLIKRQFEVYDCVFPLLIYSEDKNDEQKLCVPQISEIGQDLNSFYKLSIDSNFKIPLKNIYGSKSKKEVLTQLDFPALIKYAEQNVK